MIGSILLALSLSVLSHKLAILILFDIGARWIFSITRSYLSSKIGAQCDVLHGSNCAIHLEIICVTPSLEI